MFPNWKVQVQLLSHLAAMIASLIFISATYTYHVPVLPWISTAVPVASEDPVVLFVVPCLGDTSKARTEHQHITSSDK